MQLAAHPYDMQDERCASRIAKDRDLFRVAASDLSSLRCWQQGGGGNRNAWKRYPSANTLCCNGRVSVFASFFDIMTLALCILAKDKNHCLEELLGNTNVLEHRTLADANR